MDPVGADTDDGLAVAAPARREVRKVRGADRRRRAVDPDLFEQQLQGRLVAGTAEHEARAVRGPLRCEGLPVERRAGLMAGSKIPYPDVGAAVPAGVERDVRG